jgi:hypothetical protein
MKSIKLVLAAGILATIIFEVLNLSEQDVAQPVTPTLEHVGKDYPGTEKNQFARSFDEDEKKQVDKTNYAQSISTKESEAAIKRGDDPFGAFFESQRKLRLMQALTSPFVDQK